MAQDAASSVQGAVNAQLSPLRSEGTAVRSDLHAQYTALWSVLCNMAHIKYTYPPPTPVRVTPFGDAFDYFRNQSSSFIAELDTWNTTPSTNTLHGDGFSDPQISHHPRFVFVIMI